MKQFYFILTIVLGMFLSLNTLQAQIVYTDVIPDTTVSEFLHGYGLDFNDDDKNDLHVVLLDNVGVWVMMLIPDSDLDETFVLYDGEEASILEYGDDISATSNYWKLGSGWGALLYGYWENDGEYGNWINTQEDKYLGIKFQIDEQIHYGWIYLTTRVFATDDMEFTIQSFAYNTVAGESITAGETGEGIGFSEFSGKSFSIYPNPVQDRLFLDKFEDIESIKITDISGKQVYESINTNDLTIDVSSLHGGVYFVNIQTKTGLFTGKFIKEL